MYLTASKPSTFIVLFMFCLLVRASSSVGALDKRSGDEHDVIGSFSTDPEEDEIILNEENLRPEYSQTEDTGTYDDFPLQGIMRNLREKRSTCEKPGKTRPHPSPKGYVLVHECSDHCRCAACVKCEWGK
ncbi:uncharacterized protein LOC110067860 [Orbicella faveolata]|uniref:uncharacterized protein LOC110067860 n=1 Tax=Orbicella faveolata TaxID=48498 RepID=UPI0009E6109A|nr:uncharacterized protein LOC110067860 [Orbicella faveolata]